MTVDIGLPADLHDQAVKQLDALRQRGRLLYSESQPEIVTHKGFTFEFRICPILIGKIVHGKDAPERSGGGPFVNPDLDFVVARIGQHHTMLLNLRCIYRPHYVLHTNAFAPQSDDLDLSDISAAWAVMQNHHHTAGPQMMIYNCGVDAGSSQGHKHMQIFPQPTSIALFPDTAPKSSADGGPEIISAIPNVPYHHFVLRLPPAATAKQIYASLQKLLVQARKTLGSRGDWEDHNVILTDDWVCVIPRRHAMVGTTGANGAAIMGLVWARDQEERDSWDKLGLTQHLAYLAIER